MVADNGFTVYVRGRVGLYSLSVTTNIGLVAVSVWLIMSKMLPPP